MSALHQATAAALALACLRLSSAASAQPAPPAAPAASAAPARATPCLARTQPKPAAITDVLATAGGTLALPAYLDLAGSATTPPIASQADPAVPATAAFRVSAANFDAQPAPSNASAPVLYASLVFNEAITFGDGSLAFRATSPCTFAAGYAYFVSVRAAGMVLLDAASVPYDPATNGVSFASAIPGGLQIPGDVVVDIVVSRK